MKTTLIPLSMALLSFITAGTNAFAQKKGKDKILVNKTYTVEITETTGKKVGKTDNDEISFKSEKLNSKWMTTNNHFPAALYTVSVDSSSTPPSFTFTSEGKDQDGQDIKWEGSVTGDDIEGTAVISKKGKTKKEYAFTGALKPKPGAKK